MKSLLKRPRISLRLYRLCSLWAGRAIVLLILSGGAVRLTGSGLGCPDWPNCTAHSVLAPSSFHAQVEDANRLLNAVVIVLLIGLALGSLFVVPYSRRLVALSFSLAGCIVLEAFVGALVVYSHLYPPVVALHFLASLFMLSLAVWLHHEASERRAARRQGFYFEALLLLLLVTVFSGTIATGAGPHGGAPDARRLPLTLATAVAIHACAAALLVFALFEMVLKYWREVGKRPGWLVLSLALSLAQGLVGLLQFALRLPVGLVELHLFLAAALTSSLVKARLEGIEELGPVAQEGSPASLKPDELSPVGQAAGGS